MSTRRQRLVSLVVLVWSPVVAVGCEPVPDSSAACRVVEMSDRIQVRAVPPTDVVIAVDSSPSSAPFRGRIAAAAGGIAGDFVDRAIATAFLDGTPGVHVSVVGGDLDCPGTPGELGRPRTRVSADAPAHCADEYASTQAWPEQSREEIIEAVECLAWASDGCEEQRPFEAGLASAYRVSTGVARPGALLALYVVSAKDESERGLTADEAATIAGLRGSWLDVRVIAGIPSDLVPIVSGHSLTSARGDARVLEGGVGCEIPGGTAPVARRLFELAAATWTHVGSVGVDSICTGERSDVLPGVERLSLGGACLSRLPSIDPVTGATDCTIVETPSTEGAVPPPCAERPGRHPEPLAVDADGRETCSILETPERGQAGWLIDSDLERCGDSPFLRFEFAPIGDPTFDVHCVHYVSDRAACE